jgi:hypothetical protein
MKFQIRGVFFNARNQVNFGTTNRFVNTPQFGAITGAAAQGREVHLSARLGFWVNTRRDPPAAPGLRIDTLAG